MNDETQYKLGDVVRFTPDFYDDPHVFAPTYQVHDEWDSFVQSGYNNFTDALKQVEGVVTDFWNEGVFIQYALQGFKFTTNHFWWEVEPMGERRTMNDASQYSKGLF